jgi:hypothetical protein
MVWDSTNKCWIKADQPTHKVYIDPLNAENNAIYADPNLKVVIGWQAPKSGTVDFLADGANWYMESVYQILDKNGIELKSAYVASASGAQVSAANISVAAGDRVYFCYRPNSSTASSIFKHWPIKIEATFTPVNYRTSFITTPFEGFEGAFDWEILEGFDAGVTLSKQSDVKFEGTSAMNWHFVRQTLQDPWTRGGKMFTESPVDWSAYSHVILKFKSNTVSAAGELIFWQFLQDGEKVNGNLGCGSFEIPADTEWHTFTLEFADFPRNNVTDLEFYTSNDSFEIGTYDFYFDDIQLAIAVMPGDANNDGMVDVGDLGILAANYGGTGKTWFQGDFNADGSVDVGDLGILAANYGKAEEGKTSSSAAGDFSSDWAKVMGSTSENTDTDSDTTTTSSLCSGLGLPLIAGMLLAGMLLLVNSKFED